MFGAAVTTVTVDVGLAGTLLAGGLGRVGGSAAAGLAFPRLRAGTLWHIPPASLAREICREERASGHRQYRFRPRFTQSGRTAFFHSRLLLLTTLSTAGGLHQNCLALPSNDVMQKTLSLKPATFPKHTRWHISVEWHVIVVTQVLQDAVV